ncbi:hypothetical protein KM043_009134 [Ampulex compressa]|nr:hypothetical protein KM043_009134 [Ampulex compressa]
MFEREERDRGKKRRKREKERKGGGWVPEAPGASADSFYSYVPPDTSRESVAKQLAGICPLPDFQIGGSRTTRWVSRLFEEELRPWRDICHGGERKEEEAIAAISAEAAASLRGDAFPACGQRIHFSRFAYRRLHLSTILRFLQAILSILPALTIEQKSSGIRLSSRTLVKD